VSDRDLDAEKGAEAAALIAWRRTHPYEAAVQILQVAVANPFAPVGLLTCFEAFAVLERLGEPTSVTEGTRL